MNKQKLTIGIVVIVCVLTIVLTIYRQEPDRQNALEASTATATNEVEDTTEKPVEDTTESTTEQAEKDTHQEISTSNNDVTEAEKQQETKEEKDDSTDTSKEIEGISFPYQIPNTELEIQSLSGYQGIYVEDGSDETVKKVATILVKNKSKQVVEYGTIALQAGEKTLEFTLSALPAGKSCIVMEKNKTSYNKKWTLQYKEGNFAYTEKMSKLESDISLKTENTGITIKNKTDKMIPRIRLFYKYQLDSGEYVGGITYTCVIDDLEGGESRTVYPSHFSSEGSVIMMARRYEEKED